MATGKQSSDRYCDVRNSAIIVYSQTCIMAVEMGFNKNAC